MKNFNILFKNFLNSAANPQELIPHHPDNHPPTKNSTLATEMFFNILSNNIDIIQLNELQPHQDENLMVDMKFSEPITNEDKLHIVLVNPYHARKLPLIFPQLTYNINNIQSFRNLEKSKTLCLLTDTSSPRPVHPDVTNSPLPITMFKFRVNSHRQEKFNMILVPNTSPNLLLSPEIHQQILYILSIADHPLHISAETINTAKKLTSVEFNKQSIQNIHKLLSLHNTKEYNTLQLLIEDTEEHLIAASRRLEEHKNKLKQIEHDIILRKTENNENNIIKLFEKFDILESIEIPSNQQLHSDGRYIDVKDKDFIKAITFITHPIKWTKYDTQTIKERINTLYPDYQDFQEILKKMINKEVDLYFGRYAITFALRTDLASAKLDVYLYPLDRIDKNLFNPHQNIHCWGNYLNYIIDALKNKDIPRTMIVILEYLSSVNIFDIGSSKLPECCYAVDKQKGEIIYANSTLSRKIRQNNILNHNTIWHTSSSSSTNTGTTTFTTNPNTNPIRTR